MMEKSTENLIKLLNKSSLDDLKPLFEYNLGKSTNISYFDIDDLVNKLKYNGSNNFDYLRSGNEGVHYLKIVRDVASQMKVEWTDDEIEETIEQNIIINVFEKAWANMSVEEREDLKKIFDKQGIKNRNYKVGIPAGVIAGVVANAVARQLLGRGVAMGAGAVLGRAGGLLLGPIGIAISSIILIIDIAGPAYRKTVPSVLHIAWLRQKLKAVELGAEVM